MSDIVVVGGGVIGLSCAWELAGAGWKVAILDQAEPGREASWAGAGMIPPGDLLDNPTHQLAVLSEQRWPEISVALKAETGIDNEYRATGGLLLAEVDQLPALLQTWQEHGAVAEVWDASSLRSYEPELGTGIRSAVWLPEMAQVRNPRHLKALKAACELRGVKVIPDARVIGWEEEQGRVQAAVTENARFTADKFLVTAGAWSASVLSSLRVLISVEPMHGQIVLLKGPQPVFSRVIENGKRYLVPRLDGRVLIGATEERIGFEKRNTSAVIQELLDFAQATVPALSGFAVERTWSGLRPFTPRQRPYLGRSPEFENLFVATGHFRAGLSNSPGTALLMRQLLTGESPALNLDDFAIQHAMK